MTAAVALCDRQPHGFRQIREVDVGEAVASLLIWREDVAITDHAAPLIRRAQAGDRDAFGELYSRHQDRVRRYLASRLGSGHAADIDDLLAETFLTALQRISTFQLDQPGEFCCWLIGIARFKFLGWLKRSSRETVTDEPWAAAGAEPASPSAEDVALDRIEVAEALARVTPAAGRALVMQHVAGLLTAEIALALGTTKRAVHELTGLARRDLRGEAPVCACGCGAVVRPRHKYATRACSNRAVAARVLCACGCGAALPAVRHHRRRYATLRCRNRAAWQRRKAAQRRHLAGPVTADPAVGRVLALVQAAGGSGVDRGELSRRTRFLVARIDRALDLLARQQQIAVVLEPSNGRLVMRYRALTGAAATAWRAA